MEATLTSEITLVNISSIDRIPTVLCKYWKVIPTYALLPQTLLLAGNQGYLCVGWDAFAPRFIMTEKYEEMLSYLRKGRKVRVTIPSDLALVDDLLVSILRATKYAASQAIQAPSLYFYTYDESFGNFRQTRIL